MGIRATLTDTKDPGTNPEQIQIKITADNKGGGGGTFQADVGSTFPTSAFNYVANSASPMPDSESGGVITWKNRTVNDDGTDFTYVVTCVGKNSSGNVGARVCAAGSTTNCDSTSKQVKC